MASLLNRRANASCGVQRGQQKPGEDPAPVPPLMAKADRPRRALLLPEDQGPAIQGQPDLTHAPHRALIPGAAHQRQDDADVVVELKQQQQGRERCPGNAAAQLPCPPHLLGRWFGNAQCRPLRPATGHRITRTAPREQGRSKATADKTPGMLSPVASHFTRKQGKQAERASRSDADKASNRVP